MGWLKRFLHKEKKNKTPVKFGKVNVEKQAQQSAQKSYQEWYENLSPEQKKRVDNKMMRRRLKYGTPVVCIKCGQPGGTLRKVAKKKYIHTKCL